MARPGRVFVQGLGSDYDVSRVSLTCRFLYEFGRFTRLCTRRWHFCFVEIDRLQDERDRKVEEDAAMDAVLDEAPSLAGHSPSSWTSDSWMAPST